MPTWLKLGLGFGTTILFLWLLLAGVDSAAVVQAVSSLSFPIIIQALLYLGLGYLIRVTRWWWMLKHIEPKVRMSACFWPYISSIAVNNVLPFRAGDALRVFGFRKQLHAPRASLFGTLIVEKILDVVVLIAIVGITVSAFEPLTLPAGFETGFIWLSAISLSMLLTLIVTTPKLGSAFEYLSTRSLVKRHGFSMGLQDIGSHLTATLNSIRTPKRLITMLIFTVLVWLCEGAMFATVASSMANLAGVGPWLSMASGTLATIIPSSPGHVGTFDYFTAQSLVFAGTSKTEAIGFALTVHIVLWLPITILGLSYLTIRGTQFWNLQPPKNPPSSSYE